MENAFKPGDPVLDLAGGLSKSPLSDSLTDDDDGDEKVAFTTRSSEHWVVRKEQEIIDKIVNGTSQHHYHLLIGEKGTGKSSMLIEAMRKIDGEGIAMFDAHADLEIFRVRLGS
jgi:hypothetical protein